MSGDELTEDWDSEGCPLPSHLIISRDENVPPVDPHQWLEECRLKAREKVPGELFEKLDPLIWTLMPWGHKIIVLRIPPDTRYGQLIEIPEAHRQQNASGWVLTIGVDVCVPMDARYPSVCPHPHPLDLVGAKVNFGLFVGSPIRFSGLDSDYGQEPDQIKCVEMTIGDVHGEVLEPTTEGGQQLDLPGLQPT